MFRTPVDIPFVRNLVSTLPEIHERIEDTYQFRCIAGLLSSTQESTVGITKEKYVEEYHRLDAFICSFEIDTMKKTDAIQIIPSKCIQCETLNVVRLHLAKAYVAVHMLICMHDERLIQELSKTDYKEAFAILNKLREYYLIDQMDEPRPAARTTDPRYREEDDPYLSLPAIVFEYELYPSPPSFIPPCRMDFALEDIFGIQSDVLQELRDDIMSFPEFNEVLKLKHLLETKKSIAELGLPTFDLKDYSWKVTQARNEYMTRAGILKMEILWKYFMNRFTPIETFAALVSNDFISRHYYHPHPRGGVPPHPFRMNAQPPSFRYELLIPPVVYTKMEPVFSFVPMPLEEIKKYVLIALRLYLRAKYMKIYMGLLDTHTVMGDDQVSRDEVIENLDLYNHFAHDIHMRYIPPLGNGVGAPLGLFENFEDDLIYLNRSKLPRVSRLKEDVPKLEPDLSTFTLQ